MTTQTHSEGESNQAPITHALFPEERLLPSYPFTLWSIGWMAILKSVIWLFTDPNGPDAVLANTAIKYIIFSVPLLVAGIAIWNKKKWAVWTLIAVSILEILFFLVYPQSLETLVLDHLTNLTLTFSILIYIINGPVGDIVMLFMLPFALKQCGPK